MSGARDAPQVQVEVLLVEGSPDEAVFMVEALKEGELGTNVTVVEDGDQALHYLHQRGPSPPPDLILLNLHLSRKNGQEVLANIEKDKILRRIPVVILTASESEKATLRTYDLRTYCCVPKPSSLEQFALAVHKIEQFWSHSDGGNTV